MRCLAVPKGKLGYAYTNTRVRVMKSKLLQKQDYDRLAKMSVPEIARFLSDSEYKKEFDELGMHYKDAQLIEYALNKNLSNSFRKIYNFSIKDARNNITLYLKRWDVWNIKTILRGKRYNARDSEILANLIPAGSMGEEELKNLITSNNTYEEVIKALAKSEYGKVLKKYASEPEKLEDAIDRHYYKTLSEQCPEEMAEFVKSEIDSINKVCKARAKDTELKFTPLTGGTEKKKFRIKSKPKAQESSTIDTSLALKKKQLELGSKLVHKFKRNIEPVLGYFLAKEAETRNLRVLARGKQSGLASEMIEKCLVF